MSHSWRLRHVTMPPGLYVCEQLLDTRVNISKNIRHVRCYCHMKRSPLTNFSHKFTAYLRKQCQQHWPVRQFTMCLFSSIFFVCLRQLFGDNQLRNVYPVAKQIWYRLLCIFNSAIRVSVNKNLLQATVYEVCHQRAVIATDSFNAFAIDFVVYFWFCEVHTSVPFLVNEKIRKIYLQHRKLQLQAGSRITNLKCCVEHTAEL